MNFKACRQFEQSFTSYSHVSSRGPQCCIDVFKKIRTDNDFDLFWEFAKPTQNSLQVKDPALPCACKRPRRYED